MTYTKQHLYDILASLSLLGGGMLAGLELGRFAWLTANMADGLLAVAVAIITMAILAPLAFRSVWRSEALAWDKVRQLEAADRGLRADLAGMSTEAFRLREDIRRLEGVLSDTLTPHGLS